MLALVPAKLAGTSIRSINPASFAPLHVFSVLVLVPTSALNVNSPSTWLPTLKAHAAPARLDVSIVMTHLQSAINANLYLICKALNVWALPAKMDLRHIMSPVWTIIYVWSATKTAIRARMSHPIAKAVKILVILSQAKRELIYASCALLHAWHAHRFLYVLAATQVSFSQLKHALVVIPAAKTAWIAQSSAAHPA